MRDFAAVSHAGYRRRRNEDCHGAEPVSGLWVVADGVGGNVHGDVAAAIAVSTLRERVAAGDGLEQAIARSHAAILQEMHQRDHAEGMGTTVIALRTRGEDYEIAWVGDSRAYLYDGSLRRLTRDHGPVGEMLARGEITDREAAEHPDRNLLNQSLGISVRMRPAPEVVRGRLQPGNRLLLCTDGLSDELPDREIERLMASSDRPRAQADALLRAALDAGGHDNITAIVVGDRTSGETEPVIDEGRASAPRKRPGPLLLLAALAGAAAVGATLALL
jgi:protein phosphatase